ncbi:hypothetical protein [Vibrio barjaei]|uniref:hypothetical protein n=1 Tax=Vibrio barjaei TaxID=1676683 RepID=UPI0022840595|nr:hypothetical protein [Vibrio barjaei]MCY9870443.1 hypothetical protein [Vibrio barjaei]
MKNRRPTFLFDADGLICQWTSRMPEFLTSKGLPTEPVLASLKANDYISIEDIFSTKCTRTATELLEEYNRSHHISQLDPICQSTGRVLRELAKIGDLIAVTCIGKEEISAVNRARNLEYIAKKNLFKAIHCLDFGESKEPIMNRLRDEHNVMMFVDDRPHHVQEAMRAGINAYQFTYKMNESSIDENLQHLCSWSEIEAEGKRLVALNA